MQADDEGRDYDSFHLNHLQSVEADGAWYQNLRFIGKGGNGTTFFVTCTSGPNSGVQFALKVFHKISDDKRRQRFLAEVGHYRELSHPSIIKFHDAGTYHAEDREYPFAVVDFVPTNLAAKLGRRATPQIPRLDAIRYLLNIASGLQYLHGRGIAHRDIKPENILVGEQGARLGDLGLAKTLMGEGEEAEEDVAAYIAMPRFYRTPELVRIARGEDVILTVASDIYQLGTVLYRAVTGFNPQQIPRDVREDIALDVRPIPGIGGHHLGLLVGRMLESDPARRPTSTEVVTELGRCHGLICEADANVTGMFR